MFSESDASMDFRPFTADEAYHTIGQIEVSEVIPESVDQDPLFEGKSLGQVIITAGKLLAFGKKVWAIIESGRPVIQAAFAPTVSVLPNIAGPQAAFYEMESWSMPKVKSYKIVYKNLLGMKVVSFTYSVHYQFGGSYQGKGRYLTGVDVVASNVEVSWGYQFNASSSVVAITNRGTSVNPNAGLTIKISYLAKSVFKEIKSSESFHLTGEGSFSRIQ